MKPMLCIFAVVALLLYIALRDDNQSARVEEPETLSLYELCIWELVRREGIELKPYTCPAGHLTVGIGNRVDSPVDFTLDEARRLAGETLQQTYDDVTRYLPEHSRNECLAVAMLSHNIGLYKLRASPQWGRIKDRTADVVEMWQQYVFFHDGSAWVRSANLEKARAFEVALWSGDETTLRAMRNELKTNAEEAYKRAVQ